MTTRLICADVLDGLAQLEDESVHCVVTSPPYWSLRDYREAGQLGLERTPEEYVERLVGIFREVRRVLRADGTAWLNMGDSYAASRSYQVTDSKWRDVGNTKASDVPAGLKPLDLIGIPWRLAFALQADGWWLRSAVVWAKPNPMPESCSGWRWERHRIKVEWWQHEAMQQMSSDEERRRFLQDQQGNSAGLAVHRMQATSGTRMEADSTGTRGSEVDQAKIRKQREGTGRPQSQPSSTDGRCKGTEEIQVEQEGEGNSEAMEANAKGPGRASSSQCEAKDAVGWLSEHLDGSGMGRDQAPVSEQMPLLSQKDGAIDSGSCDTTKQRWASRQGEHCARVPVMQQQKAGQDPDVVLIDCPGCDRCSPNDGLVLRKGSWRPTSSYEFVFMLTKSADYFCDAEAVREGHEVQTRKGTIGGHKLTRMKGYKGIAGGTLKRNPDEPYGFARDITTVGRNLRNVWTIPTQPFSGVQLLRDADDGSGRRVSPDCPVHGGRSIEDSTAPHGEPRGVSPSAHSLDSDDRLSQSQASEPAPIQKHLYEHSSPDNSGSPDPACGEIATPRSKGSRRTDLVPSTLQRESDGEKEPCRIGDSRRSPDFVAKSDHIAASRIEEGVGEGVTAPDPSERTSRGTSHTCTCADNTGSIDHFATFPPKLPELCIRAGTSEKGCCSECGAPWVRVVDAHSGGTTGESWHDHSRDAVTGNLKTGSSAGYRRGTTLGFRPSCSCGAEPIPATVLDPFAGAGTTGLVASRLGRHFVGIDISSDYCRMAEERIKQDAPLFNEVAVEPH